jgi:Tol biopolymer transport system component
MAVPFDLRRLEVTGPQVAILADVMQAGGIQPLQIDTGAGQFATAESGSLVYVTGGMFPQNRWSLVWVDRNGRTEPLRVPPGAYLAPRLSPDGKRVAFNTTTGDWDLSTYDIARQVVTRLPMKGQQSLPLWTPEGSRLFYYSFVDGRHRIFSIDPDASGSPEQMMTPEDKGCRWPNDWTSDGGSIAVVCMGTGIGDGGTWIFSRTGKAEPQQIVTTAGSAGQADFAPDDRWVAYSTFQSLQVYVQPYPALNRQQQISRVNGLSPGWRRDGRELYYMEDASGDGVLRIRMMAVPVTTTPTFSAGAPRMLFEGAFRADGPFRAYDVTPDGRFLMVQEIPQPPTRASEIVLIQNWTQELKQRVPAK